MGRNWNIPFFIAVILSVQSIVIVPGGSPQISGKDLSDITMSYINRTIYLSENITVNDGDKVEVFGSTVIFNCSYDGEFGIVVNQGGTLHIGGNSTLTLNRTGNFSDYNGYNYFITARSDSNVTIKDSSILYAGDFSFNGIDIQANGTSISNTTFARSRYAIGVQGGSDISITDCDFRDLDGGGILIKDLNEKECENITISGCSFENVSCAVYKNFFSQNINKMIVTGNHVADGNFGFRLSNCDNCTLSGNQFENIKWYPFELFGVDNEVSYNEIFDCYQYSVLAGSRSVAHNNSFDSCYRGLVVQSEWGIDVVDNDFINCTDWGLDLLSYYYGLGVPRNDISNNHFSDSNTGIMIIGCGMDVHNNSFMNISNTGMYIETREPRIQKRSYNIYSNNMFEECYIGVDSKFDFECSYFDNIFINCSKEGFNGQMKNGIMEGTVCRGSRDGITLYGDNNLVSRCSIENCSSAITSYSRYSTISENDLMNCDIGMKIKESDVPPTVIDNLITVCDKGVITVVSGGTFSGNIFLDNDVHAVDEFDNKWNLSERGNYWSGATDYFDNDADGIVDTPYHIDSNSIDHYPLIKPGGPPFNRPPVAGTPPDGMIEAKSTYHIDFNASDPDGDVIRFALQCEEHLDATIDPITGIFEFRTYDINTGTHEFLIDVHDDNGSRISIEHEVEVIKYNTPPDFVGPQKVDAYPLVEKELILEVKDPDPGALDSSVIWTDAPFELVHVKLLKYRFNATFEETGTYHALFRIVDSQGKFVEANVTIRVLWRNRPPSIEGPDTFTASALQENMIHLKVSDPDPDDLVTMVSYSGEGDCFMTGNVLNLIPTLADIGERKIHILVDDGNGSGANHHIRVTVFLNNSPPLGPERISLTVRAGDIVSHDTGVVDPEGSFLDIFFRKGETPPWITFSDKGVIHVAPGMKDLGRKEYELVFTDDLDLSLVTDLILNVVEGPPVVSILQLPEKIREREEAFIPISSDYTGNGTVFFVVSSEGPVYLEGNMLRIAPRDGDRGTHTFDLTVRVKNGRSSGPYTFEIEVQMNDSTLELGIVMLPSKEEYDRGDEIRFDVNITGYSGSARIIVEIYHEGSLMDTVHDLSHSMLLSREGNWKIIARVEGSERTWEKEFVVAEEDKEQKGVSLIWVPIGLLFLISALSVFLLIGRKRREFVIDPGNKGPEERFKAAPGSGGMKPFISTHEKKYQRPRK